MATSRLSLTLCCPIYSPRTRGRSDNSNVASSSIIDPAITRFDIFFSVGLSVPAAPFLEAARYRACASRLEAARYRACASRRACVPYGCGLSALRFARSRSPHHELDEVAEPAAKSPLVVVPGEYFHHTIPNRVRERSIDDR